MSTIKGCDFLNHAINALPIELYIPGYQFCDPGTHLEKRLAKGNRGINSLDATYRKHDIAYSRSKDEMTRSWQNSAEKARKRITAKDSILGERAAAIAVWAAMKTKMKIGKSMKTKKKPMKKILLMTKCDLTYSTAIESLRLINQRRDRSKSYKR